MGGYRNSTRVAGVRYRERSQIKIQNEGHIKRRIVCQEDARIERLRQKGLVVDALQACDGFRVHGHS